MLDIKGFSCCRVIPTRWCWWDSKQVLLLISGHNKARALHHCVEGGVDHAWTISALQMHPDGIVACDEAACGELKVDTYKYFKEIYKNEK